MHNTSATGQCAERPTTVATHIDHFVEEIFEDGVANTRGAVGVHVHIIKVQGEFEVQGTNVRHGCAHGVPSNIQGSIWVLLFQSPDCSRDVWSQLAGIV